MSFQKHLILLRDLRLTEWNGIARLDHPGEVVDGDVHLDGGTPQRRFFIPRVGSTGCSERPEKEKGGEEYLKASDGEGGPRCCGGEPVERL